MRENTHPLTGDEKDVCPVMVKVQKQRHYFCKINAGFHHGEKRYKRQQTRHESRTEPGILRGIRNIETP
jgi:hypothetical protein